MLHRNISKNASGELDEKEMIMSAALALSQSVPVAAKTQAKRPALNLVSVAQTETAETTAHSLRKRAAARSHRLGGFMQAAASMAMFHAYRA
jgi:hypothetical protein